MTQELIPIDKVIEACVHRVALKRAAGRSFRKSEVVVEVGKHRDIRRILADVRARYTEWKVEYIILRYITHRIDRVLQARDANGIRVFECYASGQRERNWLPLRAMDKNALRASMTEARTLSRQLEIKAGGYAFFLDELEKLPDTARVDEVYDKVLPKILALRAGG